MKLKHEGRVHDVVLSCYVYSHAASQDYSHIVEYCAGDYRTPVLPTLQRYLLFSCMSILSLCENYVERINFLL